MRPPLHVVAAFGGRGEPMPMSSGRGSSWRFGDVVLKPAGSTGAELAWLATRLPETGLRLALPIPSKAGGYVVDGWAATRFLAGDHRAAHWLDVIAVGDALHAALVGVPRPPILDARTDPWSIADRLAWGDAAADPSLHSSLTARLGRLVRPMQVESQLVHGDLTGNVLFAEGLPPAVIDLSMYWRPRDYATAIVLVDALAWEGATARDAEPVLERPWLGQLLVRALLFRVYAARLLDGPAASAHEPRYDDALELAVSLLG